MTNSLFEFWLNVKDKKYNDVDFDCLGLVREYYNFIDKKLPEVNGKVQCSDLGKTFDEVKLSEAREGNIVLFNLGTELHVGLYYRGGEFVHCNSHGVKRNSLLNGFYKKALIGIYRPKDQ